MARPRIEFTDDQIAQIEQLSEGLTLEQIAIRLGINSRTIKRRLLDDPRVRAAYDKGRMGAINDCAQTVLAAARAGNLTAAFFFLKCQAGWREADPRQVPPAEIPNLSDRQLARERQRVGLMK